MKKSLMFLALSTALIFGCKKDNENGSSEAAVKANLSKSWQAQSVKGMTPSGFELNVYTKGSSVNLIDALGAFYVTFKNDGTFERSPLDGSTQPEKGTWTLGSDNKTITMKTTTGATLTYLADPVTANSATFRYNINVTNPTGLDAMIVEKAKAFGQTLPAGSYLNFNVIPK